MRPVGPCPDGGHLHYTKNRDWLFQHLDRTPIATGIHYDRVYPAGRLDVFNQGVRQDTSAYVHFVQAHAESYDAHYTVPSALPAADELKGYAATPGLQDPRALERYAAHLAAPASLSDGTHHTSL